MKKIVSLALALVLVLSLTACGGKTEPDVPQPTPEPVEYANLTAVRMAGNPPTPTSANTSAQSSPATATVGIP